MPAAFAGWAASAIAGAAGATAVAASVIGTIASLAVTSMMADREKRKAEATARAAYNASLRDLTMVIDNPTVPRNFILGRFPTSGPVWPWITYGGYGENHICGITLASHECHAIVQHRFGQDVLTLDGDGNVIAPSKYVRSETIPAAETSPGGPPGTAVTAAFVPSTDVTLLKVDLTPNVDGSQLPATRITNVTRVGNTFTVEDDTTGFYIQLLYSHVKLTPLFKIKEYLGAPGQQAAPELIAAAAASGNPGFWDASRKNTGNCYITLYMYADFNVLGDIGFPQYSALVDGVKPYDDRTGLSLHTSCPATLARWFMVDCPFSPDTLASEVRTEETIASANVCDELIALSASRTEKRYTCNANLSCQDIPLNNLRHILDCMDGDALYVAGQWQLMAGYDRVANITFDTNTLSDQTVNLLPAPQKSDLFNTIRGRFYNPANGWQFVSYDQITNVIYQSEDGGEVLPQPMDFIGVNDPIRCQMIAWQRLSRARNGQAIQLGTNFKGYDTTPLRTANVELPMLLGPDPKTFMVRRRDFTPPRLTYSLQETGPAVWAWDYTKANAVADIPDTSFPDILTVPIPSGVVSTSGDADLFRNPNGSVSSRIRVRLNRAENIYVLNGGQLQWQYKETWASSWMSAATVPGDTTELFLYPVVDGEAYQHRGRYVFSSGREGDWCPVVIEIVKGKTEIPRPPTAVAATPKDVIFGLSPSLDAAGYEIRYAIGSSANGSVATPLQTGLVTGSPWPMPIRLYGVITIFVRTVDDGGRFSEWVSDTQDFGVPDAANVAHSIDYAALGFPGDVTNGSVSSGDLVADVDPSVDIYGAGSGSDIYYRDGAADIYGGSQYLALEYVAYYRSPYSGGSIFLHMVASGARVGLDYQIDGATVGDVYADADGDGDIYSGSIGIYGAEQPWRTWPGVHTPTSPAYGIHFRVSIDAGSTRGELSEFAARTEMPTISQVFSNVLIDAAGTTLLPADGTPALQFIQIEDVTVTPIGSAAISGRCKSLPSPAGIPVEMLNDSAVPVTAPAFVRVTGF